ncbi:hypothetical protein [Kordiimonas sp.]|uniref:hypothetical protein n=1 Tax=Kordiimonas sp. TaxID=1970157 RepID=UPI003A939A6D
MAIFLKLLLMSLPVIVVIVWLRWRMKEDQTEEEQLADIARLKKTLAVLVVVGLAAGVGLKLVDDRTGDPRTKYIPPHSENGQVVPGRFVPLDEVDEQTSDDEEGKEDSEQGPR